MRNLKLGDKALDFKLKATDGNEYTLDDFEDAEFLAVMFSCNHCPYVIASEREFKELQDEYGPKGFQLVAINSNVGHADYPSDSYENMIKRVNEKEFNFPYLADDGQHISRAYGAIKTPEIFLFNRNRELVYWGRINDNPRELEKISRHDLKEALDELIDGKEVSQPETMPLGCTIKWIE
ncbi:MAG: thioredoxin family protein [Candidatus Heimdallarchaeota archaeon]|nr:thioredoxin family protein [Candidatus Heimdallarchaeota archaeon]